MTIGEELPGLRLFLLFLFLFFLFRLFVFRDLFLGHDVLIALGEHPRIAASLAGGYLVSGASFLALSFGRIRVVAHAAYRLGQRVCFHQEVAYLLEKIIELKRDRK